MEKKQLVASHPVMIELCLDMCEQFMDVNDMIRDEDLIVHKFNPQGNGIDNRFNNSQSVHSIQRLVANMVPTIISKRPSARELNLLKRKAKINSKDQTKGWSEDGDTAEVFMDPIVDEDNFDHDGDGRWPFHSFVEQLLLDMFDPVWEIRHGSVMALREILTHQGASAGVLMPDLSSGAASFIELKEKDNSNTLKREREIDLNMQVPADESEPNLKRLKSEDLSSPLMDTVGSAGNHANLDIRIRVEDSGCNLPAWQANGELDVSSVKVKPESYIDGACFPCKEDVDMGGGLKGDHEDKNCIGKMDVLKNLPENCELMNLIKVARHSWLKNSEFLQDCAIRFLCVLSLDRFGDYVSDQVVAPVRETCAQALGAVLKYMHPPLVHETLNILLQMQCRPEWEIRHGSLLGIKYLVAVRQEMLHNLLAHVLPACKTGLEDPDDDVRAVAADALIPTAASIVSLKGQTLHSIVMLLWDILLDLDDLSPSTSRNLFSGEMIPKMFGALASKEKQELDLNEVVCIDDLGEGINIQENPYMLSTLAPRLWPFMRHSITSVRYSAIRTLERLLEAGYKKNISEPSTSSFWPSFILGDTLRIVFQNLLLESNEEISQCSERVWRLLLQCSVGDLEDAARAAAKMRAVKLENDSCRNIGLDFTKETNLQERNGDSSANSVKIIVGADLEKSVTHTRVVTAAALGIFASKLHEGPIQYVIDPLWKALTSLSGVQRQVVSMVLISWFKEIKSRDGIVPGLPSYLKNWLFDLLACTDPAFPTKDSLAPYCELSRTYTKMRGEASQLFRAVESSGLFENLLSTTKVDPESLTADDAMSFASKLSLLVGDTSGEESMGRNIVDDLESLKQRLLTTSGYLKCVQSNLHVSVSALVAAAVVWMSELPAKLNPIILPLMASVKGAGNVFEEEILQQKAAEALAELICRCITRRPGPNDKLIKNLCSLTCMDPCETPQAGAISSMEVIEDQDLLSFGSSTGKQKSKVHILAGGEDRSKVEGFISRRGSELTLKHLCEKFGASLFDKLPKLWDCLTEVLKPGSIAELTPEDENETKPVFESIKDPQILINNIQVVRSISPMLEETVKPKLLTLLPCIFKCVRHSHVAVRLAASRCITSMAKSMTTSVMGAVIENVIPMLGDMSSVHTRQGAGMLVNLLVQDWVWSWFLCSFASCFLSSDAQFLEQLLDNSHIDDYKLSTELKNLNLSLVPHFNPEAFLLRGWYQQEGINWLAFLRRFKLHGILCDDMGLGKTLQASAIVASDIEEHRTSKDGAYPPSLIICPSTLVGHWAYEIEKYIDSSVITTLQYVGSAHDRMSLQGLFEKHNVIITSYDVLKAQHRLILSGTPIQNNILDLWSLFDFLMPGFLGTERQFQATYGKPLQAARDSKCSAKDAEAGALAMEALHKQVMPFLLRRTKDEVLSDLPEKIIQDRYCDLCPVQLKLYEQFSGSHVRHEISSIVKRNESTDTGEGNSASPKASSHVFQALQYLLKLCGHPLLVVGEKIPDSLTTILSEFFPGTSDIMSELHKLHHSPKLIALHEILEECGIGVDASSSEGAVSVGQHRVLIFAQHKAFLDIIERDLFHTHMKSVTYLRLDGSVEPEKRFEIVKAFNSDPTIDVLLLTTHVGGLGLNLTSADTLVFMEHDWNPMRDHQAMDRAHRLGQRKVVNVHRLIMRGTLEEKVMSLQRFKLSVANSVINSENASMKTMNTDQLLDLFTSAEALKKGAAQSKRSDGNFDGDPKFVGSGKGLKAILGGLEELWDHSQYTEEYNLSNFLTKLNGCPTKYNTWRRVKMGVDIEAKGLLKQTRQEALPL
ncbi:TATA-binding protein-associated factor BTAF1 [Vitis vinifera]|uniref:TATA-binding protein-associated factor BTAF1 n=1 Tax=Vitis vinifera TaxID=29760 RepID=A0A438GYF0_VITVI|nr:TATA-binding protein-associated factor BTAF1 [Vitis vinifera]